MKFKYFINIMLKRILKYKSELTIALYMMSTLFVILMYCSGMPILYFIGAVFYIVTYLVNKYLLINFYKKSTTLTRTIP